MLTEDTLSMKAFVVDNKDLFQQVAHEYKYDTKKRERQYTQLNYRYILKEMVDFVNGYIEYKENASEACSIPSKRVLISENWANQNRFGISLSQRQKRDWIVHSVSEEDINVKGICVDNPLIGALPSQTAISDELEKLISSM